MPCNGIAVLTAHTLVDLEQHMADPAHRRAFQEWLRAQGLPVCDWWPDHTGERTRWALGIASDWVGIKFVGTTIELSNESDASFECHRRTLDQAYFLAQVYAGQLAQTHILQAVAALGLVPQDLAPDANGGITFTLRAGVAVKVTVDRLGRLALVTQDGDFPGGATVLETLVKAFTANGAPVQPDGQVETHNHAVRMTLTGEHTAQVWVHQAVREDGPPHTH